MATINTQSLMEVMRRLENSEWVFFIDHPWGADESWAVDQPPRTD